MPDSNEMKAHLPNKLTVARCVLLNIKTSIMVMPAIADSGVMLSRFWCKDTWFWFSFDFFWQVAWPASATSERHERRWWNRAHMTDQFITATKIPILRRADTCSSVPLTQPTTVSIILMEKTTGKTAAADGGSAPGGARRSAADCHAIGTCTLLPFLPLLLQAVESLCGFSWLQQFIHMSVGPPSMVFLFFVCFWSLLTEAWPPFAVGSLCDPSLARRTAI